MWLCHCCRMPLPIKVQERNRLCPHCNSDIKSCLNCAHYDDNLSSKCKEPESPWVNDRSSTNSCPFFEMKPQDAMAGAKTAADANAEAEAAKQAFRALFRQTN